MMNARVYIYCEGQTEEAFVDHVLAPYLAGMGIWAYPIIHATKRTESAKYRGGVINYSQVKHELTILCAQHSRELVTTMFDYYRFPKSAPQFDCQESDICRRMEIIETAITRDLGQTNCFFGLMLHEFEALLFSKPSAFRCVAREALVAEIQTIRNQFPTPEHINNGPETAPSKRLDRLIPNYPKVTYGSIVSEEIGMDTMLEQCPHFAAWVERIIRRAQRPNFTE